MDAAIFLDKDGTLIPDIPHNVDPELITLQESSAEGLKQLYKKGYKLIVISNQSGIADGFFTADDLQPIKEKINMLLNDHGVKLEGFYYCPHKAGECICHKPLPGMLFKAAEMHRINLSASWMIGDILNDVEAGNRAGCRTILIDNGNETEWQGGKHRVPTLTCASINEAALYILSKKYANVKLD